MLSYYIGVKDKEGFLTIDGKVGDDIFISLSKHKMPHSFVSKEHAQDAIDQLKGKKESQTNLFYKGNEKEEEFVIFEVSNKYKVKGDS